MGGILALLWQDDAYDCAAPGRRVYAKLPTTRAAQTLGYVCESHVVHTVDGRLERIEACSVIAHTHFPAVFLLR